MRTLNQIIQKINSLQTSNLQLSNGTFLFGDPWEYAASLPTSGRMKYPLLGCRLISSNINGNIHSTSLNLFFADLVNKDENNETEVLSDMQIAALRVYSELTEDLYDDYGINVGLTSGLTPFTEKWDDEVSGMEMNIVIEQFFDKSTCD